MVYSPHTYGPSVYAQPYFEDETFPKNMPHIWDLQYGALAARRIAPVVVGEWGGKLHAEDAVYSHLVSSHHAEPHTQASCKARTRCGRRSSPSTPASPPDFITY